MGPSPELFSPGSTTALPEPEDNVFDSVPLRERAFATQELQDEVHGLKRSSRSRSQRRPTAQPPTYCTAVLVNGLDIMATYQVVED